MRYTMIIYSNEYIPLSAYSLVAMFLYACPLDIWSIQWQLDLFSRLNRRIIKCVFIDGQFTNTLIRSLPYIVRFQSMNRQLSSWRISWVCWRITKEITKTRFRGWQKLQKPSKKSYPVKKETLRSTKTRWVRPQPDIYKKNDRLTCLQFSLIKVTEYEETLRELQSRVTVASSDCEKLELEVNYLIISYFLSFVPEVTHMFNISTEKEFQHQN